MLTPCGQALCLALQWTVGTQSCLAWVLPVNEQLFWGTARSTRSAPKCTHKDIHTEPRTPLSLCCSHQVQVPLKISPGRALPSPGRLSHGAVLGTEAGLQGAGARAADTGCPGVPRKTGGSSPRQVHFPEAILARGSGLATPLLPLSWPWLGPECLMQPVGVMGSWEKAGQGSG